MDEMLGSIQFFAGNFAPRGYAFCDGALLPISSNTALFSLLGTTYGGDGRTTFALPDLRGRAALGPRKGPGLSTYDLGERGGQERHTLSILEMPSHNHTTTNNTAADQHVLLSTEKAVRQIPEAGDVPAAAVTIPAIGAGEPVNSFGPANATINGQTLSGNAGLTINNNGGQQPHNNMQPFLAVNYIICLQGYFPSRS